MSRAVLVRALIAVLLLLPPALALAQTEQQATLTVLRGEVGVVRPDGSAVQPAPSGTTVRAGDRIATLSPGGALITFFSGTEIEMGEATTLIVERVSRQGDQVEVSLQQVAGETLNRVLSLAGAGSSYQINAGGAVALVRGTTFLLLGPTTAGIVVLVCMEDCDERSTFLGVPLAPFIGYWAEVENGQVVQGPHAFKIDPAAGYWNNAAEGATIGERDLQGDTEGVPAGQIPGGQQQEIQAELANQEEDEDDEDNRDNEDDEDIEDNEDNAEADNDDEPLPTPTSSLQCESVEGGSECTFMVIDDRGLDIDRVELELETTEGVEERECDPNEVCEFELDGQIFQGSELVRIFVLEDGEEIRVVRFADCGESPGEPC